LVIIYNGYICYFVTGYTTGNLDTKLTMSTLQRYFLVVFVLVQAMQMTLAGKRLFYFMPARPTVGPNACCTPSVFLYVCLFSACARIPGCSGVSSKFRR